MNDIIIIGGGPAGIAAGVYAGRKKMKTVLITESFGGQSIVSDSIENWIGEKAINGFELAQKLEAHLREYEDQVEIKSMQKVLKVSEIKGGFEVETNKGEKFQAKTVLVTSGGRRKKLGLAGEEKFDGRGIVYCSTCDAPLFRDKTVAVIGGGNSGLEAVVDLFPYAKKIYLLNFDQELKGDPETQEEIKKSEKVEIINMAETTEILGGDSLEGLKYKDRTNEEIKELKLDGVFVEIGSVPNSEMIKDLVNIDKYGEVLVDHRTYETSKKGIFAAGDVTDEIYKQNNIAVGDAITAILSAYNYVLNISKKSPVSGDN